MSAHPVPCPDRQVPRTSLTVLTDLGLSIAQIARYLALDPSEVRDHMPRRKPGPFPIEG
jgi:hypothetical protein